MSKNHLIAIKDGEEYVFIETDFFKEDAIEFLNKFDPEEVKSLMHKGINSLYGSYKIGQENYNMFKTTLCSIEGMLADKTDETHFISIFDEDGTVWQDILEHNKIPENQLYIVEEMDEPIVGKTKGSWIHLHDEEQEMLFYSEDGEPL